MRNWLGSRAASPNVGTLPGSRLPVSASPCCSRVASVSGEGVERKNDSATMRRRPASVSGSKSDEASLPPPRNTSAPPAAVTPPAKFAASCPTGPAPPSAAVCCATPPPAPAAICVDIGVRSIWVSGPVGAARLPMEAGAAIGRAAALACATDCTTPGALAACNAKPAPMLGTIDAAPSMPAPMMRSAGVAGSGTPAASKTEPTFSRAVRTRGRDGPPIASSAAPPMLMMPPAAS